MSDVQVISGIAPARDKVPSGLNYPSLTQTLDAYVQLSIRTSKHYKLPTGKHGGGGYFQLFSAWDDIGLVVAHHDPPCFLLNERSITLREIHEHSLPAGRGEENHIATVIAWN